MLHKYSHLVVTVLWSIFLLAGGHQNLPPGVNPQHYQQQHMQHQQPQHMQHQQPQHMQPQQHMPVQHMQQQQVPMQQVPVQQQQMHMQQQQQQMHVPQQQMHPQMQQGQPQMNHGHDHHGQPQVLNVANIAQEKQHIAEHMSVPMDTSKMTDQELQFHYFKMHDADNNNKLDGCELIKSLIHWHEQGQQTGPNGAKTGVQEKIFTDEELVGLIDPILSLDDANSDGFIDYPEFIRAQMKAAASAPRK